MIANSEILKNTKTYLDSKYKSVVMYGASTVDGIREIYTDINNINLKAIIYVDSTYSDEEVKTTFEIIKDIIVYIDSSIKVYFIGNGARANIAKSVIAEIEKGTEGITCNFFETPKKYTTRLLEEGVLYSLLVDSTSANKGPEELQLEERSPMQPNVAKPININNIEVIPIDNNTYSNDDNRHIYLMKNIEQMIAYNNKPKDNITNKIINNIMSGEINDIKNIKTAIDQETENDKVIEEIKVALASLESDMSKLKSILIKEPDNPNIKMQLIKLEQYHKNIQLNKARYQYTTYVRVMKETSNVLTKEYDRKIKELALTTEKYSLSVEKIKQFTDDDKITEKNKEKIKAKIKLLKEYKITLETSLNNYITSIDLVYNGMQTSYIEAMTDIRKIISDTTEDMKRIPEVQNQINNSVLKGITDSKMVALTQLHSDGKHLSSLKKESVNNLKTLLKHTDNINSGLRKLVSVLELIVIEQDKYINYIETQSKKRLITYDSIKDDYAKEPLIDKIFVSLGVDGVGKTGVTLSSAYALSKCNNKKVLVIDLAYTSPQAYFYTTNESFAENLLEMTDYSEDYIKHMFDKHIFKTLFLPYELEGDKEIVDTVAKVEAILKNAPSIIDHVFVILPQDLSKVSGILSSATRLILITDLDVSHYRGTGRLVDKISNYEDTVINNGEEAIKVKYFIINKCLGTIDLDSIAEKCSIDNSEYTIRQFNHLDKIMLSKNEGSLRVKDSNAILNNTNWIGAELYE